MQPLAHSFTSPLRYPGGKGMLAKFIKLVLSQNDLLNGEYVEVYAGGAGIAWPLLFEEYVQHVTINDRNRSVFAFWQAVLCETEPMCKLIRDTRVTIEERNRQKAIQLDSTNHSTLELGFSTFFLNRTNWSGILKGGVIGGKAQNGKWKLDARFNKPDLIARIQRIARYRKRITICNYDASVFIKKVLPNIPKRTLVYLDPPYYVKGEGLYEHHYTHDDHVRIANLVGKHIKQPWIVSYDAAEEIIEVYGQYRSIRYDLNYRAQERYAGSEIMFFSKKLIVPNIAHPARLQATNAREQLL